MSRSTTHPSSDPKGRPVPGGLRDLAWRCLALSLLWLGLNGPDGASWIVGVPVVLAGAWVSRRLATEARLGWSWIGALAFAGFFLRESLRGAWDVARRALAPRLPLGPGILRYEPRLPEGPARLFLCQMIGLLPGTAVVEAAEDHLAIHALDVSPEVEEEVRRLEHRIAAMLAIPFVPGKERAS